MRFLSRALAVVVKERMLGANYASRKMSVFPDYCVVCGSFINPGSQGELFCDGSCRLRDERTDWEHEETRVNDSDVSPLLIEVPMRDLGRDPFSQEFTGVPLVRSRGEQTAANNYKLWLQSL